MRWTYMLGWKRWIRQKKLNRTIREFLKKVDSPIKNNSTVYMAETYTDMWNILEVVNKLLDQKSKTKEDDIAKIALIENIGYTLALVGATMTPGVVREEKPPFSVSIEVEEKIKKLYENFEVEVLGRGESKNDNKPNYVG